jgi:ubiquinone/menaquinone biosynthesis C-methylase UbiE
MRSEAIAKSAVGKLIVQVLGAAMESRFRYRFFSPTTILGGVDNLSGNIVLEVGCGTGYFTVPAARLIGDQGSLIAIDVLSESIELVSKKVETANLENVHVVKGDALATKLIDESFHTVLLFGVIPSPMLPLNRLLPELHRVLKAEGTLAVWTPIPGWFPQSILQSGLFAYSSKRNGVHNFTKLSLKGEQ